MYINGFNFFILIVFIILIWGIICWAVKIEELGLAITGIILFFGVLTTMPIYGEKEYFVKVLSPQQTININEKKHEISFDYKDTTVKKEREIINYTDIEYINNSSKTEIEAKKVINQPIINCFGIFYKELQDVKIYTN